MHAALANLMSVALLVHALLGCCWHHGHGCDVCGEHATSLAQSISCGRCHDDDESADGHLPASHSHDRPCHCPGPCNCRVECQAANATLPPEKMGVAKAVAVAPFDCPAPAVLLPLSAAPLGLAGQGQMPAEWALCGSAVRLHLMHQILL